MSPRSCRAARQRPRPRRVVRGGTIASVLLTLASGVVAGEPVDTQPLRQASAGGVIATRDYKVPDVRLVRDDGRSVSLPQEMNDGRLVVLNFIFTTCSSVCPLMSQILAQFQQGLGADRDRVHIMSISIDPEEDTPARLREYAHKFHAGPEWQHYTGTVEASVAAQRAFGVYRGDKMSHAVVTLLRAAPDQPWRRMEGLVTPEDLLIEYRRLVSAPQASLATR
jgi:protein SCO1